MRTVKLSLFSGSVRSWRDAGDVRIRLSHMASLIATLAGLDTTARYGLLHTIYYANEYAKRETADRLNAEWRQAAAEKRIKTRKNSRRCTVKVWIEAAAKA